MNRSVPLPLLAFLVGLALLCRAELAVAAPSGVVEIRDSWFLKSDAPQLPGADEPWRRQTLPDSWRESRPGQQGYGWYRADFALPQQPAGMHAIYISLVSTEYTMYVNGMLVGESPGMRGQIGRNAGFPQWVTVPPELLRAGGNSLAVRLRVGSNLRGGLTPVFLGPQQAVEALHAQDDLWRTVVPRALNTAMLALGLLVLLLWSRQRAEAVYGWLGSFLVLTSLWSLRNFHQSITLPQIPSLVWETFVLAGHGVSRLFLLMFVLRYVGQSRPWLERAAVWAMLLLPIAMLTAGEVALSAVRTPFYSATALPMWYSIWLLARYSNWRRERGAFLVMVALVASEALAIHDWLIAVTVIPFGTLRWLDYGLALMMSTMTVALAERYFAAFATARQLTRELEQRVAQKTRELDDNYRKVAAYEQAAALDDERCRLMRDMHDGIGSQLITAASAAERGQLAPAEIAALLRACIDDLRMVIDSLEPGHSDLALALASLRYRLAPRLQAAGLASRWDMETLPSGVILSPTQVLQVLRVVQEALTNVIKHAHAGHAALTAVLREDCIEVRIDDDGRGNTSVDPSQRAGRGLANMRHRAASVGGTVSFDFGATGSSVVLRLPLQHSVVAASA